MPRVNLATLDRLEANEFRQRKQVSQLRAIRRAKHAIRRAHAFQPTTAQSAFSCPDCGGDCKSLMAAMQDSLKGGR